MKAQVMEIQPTNKTGKFDVIALIGTVEHKFTLKINIVPVSDQEIYVTNGDLWSTKFNTFSRIIVSGLNLDGKGFTTK